MNKSNIALLAAAASALLVPLCANAGAADDARIRALEMRFAAAVNARNLGAIMSVYSPDVFVFDVIPPRQYVGATAYRDNWKNFLAGYSGPVRFEITDLAVSPRDRSATATASSTSRGRIRRASLSTSRCE